MDKEVFSDPTRQGAAKMHENSDGKPGSGKKRHRNRKKSDNKEKNSKPLNGTCIQVALPVGDSGMGPVTNHTMEASSSESPRSGRDCRPPSSIQGGIETAGTQAEKSGHYQGNVSSGAVRNGSGNSASHDRSGARNSVPEYPGTKDAQSPDCRGQRDGQNQGNRRWKGDQKRDKRPVFNPHWSKEMVSEGLKKGFLVQGIIRINPKNYEDAYIPESDGVSDIYISGYANRNRAMNGDVVAVLLNDRKDWRVFMDSLELYEADLQMASLSIKETEKGDSKSSTQQHSGDMQSSVPNICKDDELSQSANSAGKSTDASDNSCHDSSQSKVCSQQQASAGHSVSGLKPKSDQQVNKTPNKQSSQNKTPASKGRYTSVKDLLSKDGCSPGARKLFCEKREKEEGLTDSDMKRFLQITGTIVSIVEAKHSRACSGHIKPMTDKKQNHALFCPTDHRCPRIMVPLTDCPKDLLERPQDHANTLFIARITDWPDTSHYAHGRLARSLGEAGQIEPETEGMLIEYDIDYSEFSDQVLDSLPSASPWVIPAEELANRKDFRKQCIFTIDPATARDLDDALSCEDLGNGLYEVGVHIADVTYFLKEDTDLDKIASKRATSVYLVQKVVPMLPRLLCEELCSLNPDKDRLTFSVIWHINEDAEIQGEWFGRSVIRSCCKMGYDHAQGFIENPELEYTREELPPISEGFSVPDLQKRVLNLHKLAQKLRQNRFDSGALRLDQVKLQFSLNKDTGLPNGYTVYKQRDSNKLVEEFMLLANMAVGHKILKSFPDTALLRHHPPPQSKMLNDLYDMCINLDVPVDISSSGALQQSLNEYAGDDEFSSARLQVLISLCSKPMQNARYFCTGIIKDEDQYHHYALNVPVYTHFTSPIRRYADVIVHRLLGASLGCSEEPNKSPEMVMLQASHCNDKKLASKCVQERSSDIYFAVFVKEVGPLEESAMVMAVLDRSFDIFVLKLGVIKRVYCEKLPLESFTFRRDHKRPCLTLTWSPTELTPDLVTQEISIFSMVTAVLQAEKEPLKWSASIRHPEQEK